MASGNALSASKSVKTSSKATSVGPSPLVAPEGLVDKMQSEKRENKL